MFVEGMTKRDVEDIVNYGLIHKKYRCISKIVDSGIVYCRIINVKGEEIDTVFSDFDCANDIMSNQSFYKAMINKFGRKYYNAYKNNVNSYEL